MHTCFHALPQSDSEYELSNWLPGKILVAGTLVLQMPLQFLWLMPAAPAAVAAHRDCCAGIPIYYRTLLRGVGKEQSPSVTAFCISAPCHPAAASA